MAADEQSLADLVAQGLAARTDDILEGWVDWMREQSSTPLAEPLPIQAVCNQLRPALAQLAHHVQSPSSALTQQMLGHLQAHGQARWDQGYSLRDTLHDFDTLARRIDATAREAVLAHGREWALDDTLAVFERLASGLRALVFAVCGSYHKTERARTQSIARGLSQFARASSHELLSPLQVISMEAESLRGDVGEADLDIRAEQLSIIQASVRRTVGLQDGIRLLVMAETALTEHRMQNLGETLARVHEEISRIAQRNGVRLVFPTSEAAVAVEGVVAQLILFNLLSNGIKYADPNKPERWVRLEARLVDVDDARFVRFEVSDNGLGIQEDLQAKVFQPRFRAHPRVGEGTGLGLAMSQSLVTERGGVIEVRSQSGQGSRFAFSLRAIRAQAAADADPGPSEFSPRGVLSNGA